MNISRGEACREVERAVETNAEAFSCKAPRSFREEARVKEGVKVERIPSLAARGDSS